MRQSIPLLLALLALGCAAGPARRAEPIGRSTVVVHPIRLEDRPVECRVALVARAAEIATELTVRFDTAWDRRLFRAVDHADYQRMEQRLPREVRAFDEERGRAGRALAEAMRALAAGDPSAYEDGWRRALRALREMRHQVTTLEREVAWLERARFTRL